MEQEINKTGPSKDLNKTEACIITMDVGQGDCTFVKLGDFKALIDCGRVSEGRLAWERLKQHNIGTVNLNIITHSDSDHRGGFGNINGPATPAAVNITTDPTLEKNNGTPYELFKTARLKDGEELFLCTNNKDINDVGVILNDKNLKNTPKHYKNHSWMLLIGHALTDRTGNLPNNYSPMILTRYGKHFHLVCGDLTCTANDANKIIKAIEKSGNATEEVTLSVLMPHHGSFYSCDGPFLATLDSKYKKRITAMISCNSFEYDHPHVELLQQLAALRIKTYITNLYNYKIDNNKLGLVRVCGTSDYYGDIPLIIKNNQVSVQLLAEKNTGPTTLENAPYVEEKMIARKNTKNNPDKFITTTQNKIPGMRNQNTMAWTRDGEGIEDGYAHFGTHQNKRQSKIAEQPLREFYNKFHEQKTSDTTKHYLDIMKTEAMQSYLQIRIGRTRKANGTPSIEALMSNVAFEPRCVLSERPSQPKKNQSMDDTNTQIQGKKRVMMSLKPKPKNKELKKLVDAASLKTAVHEFLQFYIAGPEIDQKNINDLTLTVCDQLNLAIETMINTMNKKQAGNEKKVVYSLPYTYDCNDVKPIKTWIQRAIKKHYIAELKKENATTAKLEDAENTSCEKMDIE